MTGRPAAGPDHNRADAVTVSVLSEMNAPDPRIGRLTQSLVMHVHAFLVENQVTWEEWPAGLDDVSFGVTDGLVLDFLLDEDPAATAANGMPGPSFDVTCDLVLTPDTPMPEAEA